SRAAALARAERDPAGHHRSHRGAGGRRALHRPHRPRRDGRADGLRATARHSTAGASGPRPSRAANPPGLRRQEPAHRPRRAGRGALRGDGRAGRSGAPQACPAGRGGGRMIETRAIPFTRAAEAGSGGARMPAVSPAAWGERRHVLDLDDFSADDIEVVLRNTAAMKEILRRPIARVPALRGKTVVNMFFEASTRTRVSFELAAKNLGADVVSVAAGTSSVTKGESLLDTIRTLRALGADLIVIRHADAGAPYLVARGTDARVINAGDGWHAHPTQALLDLFTIRERLGRIAGLKVVILGDILHSRVARSNAWGLAKLGARVVLCGPPTLLPPASLPPRAQLPWSVEVEV